MANFEIEAVNQNFPAGTRKILNFKGCELAFRWCPPGKFLMGSPETEKDRFGNEDQVSVTLSKGFWMMETLVTQEIYEAVTGRNPSRFKGSTLLPVEKVSWNNAIRFCKKLNPLLQEQIPSGFTITLPTEAQWEYVCRAGTTTAYCFGDDPAQLGEYAWFRENSNGKTHPVGQKKPNGWGLYDVHGNVWECVLDDYESALPGGIDPYVTNKSGSDSVLRGGSWINGSAFCRSANRISITASIRNADFGFRIALSPSG